MNTRNITAPGAGSPERIDWPEIRRRLDSVQGAIEHVASPGPKETRRILKERARVLARMTGPQESPHRHLEVVEFVLAQERYAVELQYVRDVCPLEHLTPLPCTPAFVLGIVNLRGEILSVIDIKRFFDLPDKGLTDLNKVIVLDSGSMCFGILADRIIGVNPIRMADIQTSLPTLTGIREEYLKGVTPDRTVVLDAEKLLTDKRIIVQELVAG